MSFSVDGTTQTPERLLRMVSLELLHLVKTDYPTHVLYYRFKAKKIKIETN